MPQQSTQQSISAEAAYFVFGFGAAGQVSPWTDEASLVVRNSTSAAQIAVAPDDSITVSDNLVGGGGRVRAGRRVVLGARIHAAVKAATGAASPHVELFAV